MIEVWADAEASEKISYGIFDSASFADVSRQIEREQLKDAIDAANELHMYDDTNEPPTGAWF